IGVTRSHLVWRGIERGGDRSDETVPARGFLPKAFSASRRERVELRAAFVLALAPLRVDQALVFETVQRWIQRPLWHVQDILGNLRYAQQHAIAVQRLQRDRLQNQHVESAWEQVSGCFSHVRHVLLDTL